MYEVAFDDSPRAQEGGLSNGRSTACSGGSYGSVTTSSRQSTHGPTPSRANTA